MTRRSRIATMAFPSSISMSTTSQNTQGVSLPPYRIPADAESPTNEKPAVFAERGLAEDMSRTLEQILDVLRGSNIAEERGKDVESKFWASYKKVSNEYDNDFLERANDDMAIILTFAGLFSAVNSTFIVGMQPNPADTTNILMLQLIKIVAEVPNAVNDISNLSSSTGYSSSIVWTQTLAYASLAFSLLAAFGAVMGKQWLNSYKAARGRGSLEERGMQRQRKLDGLEYWHLQTVLGAFFVLLQISLLLFGLSLSANMWTQQHTISSVIISTTGFGILFYAGTIFISVWHPDSPFQTAGSALVRSIFKKILPHSTPDIFTKSSAIRWILETSTNPEIVEAAASMTPRVQWSSKLDASAIYTRLLDNFADSVDQPELFVTYGKVLTHLRIQSLKTSSIAWKEMIIWHTGGERNRFIHDAFMDARLAYDRFKKTGNKGSRWKHMADARAALRTMLVYGLRVRHHTSLLDDEGLIWNADLRWHQSNGHTPSCSDFDWLIDYLSTKAHNQTDDETVGDALLALSAMHGLGSPARRPYYVNALIRCMAPTRPSRVRHAALRAVSDARDDLASITSDSMSWGVDATLLDELSRALITVVRSNHNQGKRGSRLDTNCIDSRDAGRCYFRLIFALAKDGEWCKRLTRDGHVEWCISLLDKLLFFTPPLAPNNFYLAGIFLRINPPGNDTLLSATQWLTLIDSAWFELCYWLRDDMNIIEGLPALVTVTRQHMPDPDYYAPSARLVALSRHVNRVLQNLKQRQTTGGQEDSLADAALLAVQDLYDELSLYD